MGSALSGGDFPVNGKPCERLFFEITRRAWLWILIFTLACLLRFLTLQPFAFASDTAFHLRYTQDFAQALFEGNGYPDWDARPYGGKGTTAFRFYAPGVYLMAALFIALGCSLGTALKLAIFSFALAGAIGTYRWLSVLGWETDFSGETNVPLFGALLLLSSPILAMHLFQIFLIQNACAILLFPLVLDGWSRLELRGQGLLQTVLAGALITLTHLPAMMMVCLAMALISCIQGILKRSFMTPLKGMLILALALGLAAPYAYPAVHDLGEIHFDRLNMVNPLERKDFLDDFEYSSAPGSGNEGIWSTFRFEYQWILLLMVMMGAFGFVLVPEKSVTGSFSRLFGGVGFALLFMTLRPSAFLWKVIPRLIVLQYPWRFLFPAFILLLPILVSIRGAQVLHGWKRLIRGFCWFVFLASFLFTLAQNLMAKRTIDLPDVLNIIHFYPHEYIPKTCNDSHLPEAGKVRELKALEGEVAILQEKNLLARSDWEISIPTWRARLEIVTHFDPCWRVAVDGVEMLPQLSRKCGLMMLDVPTGRHHLVLYRIPPPSRVGGWLLYGLSLTLLLFWLLNPKFYALTKADPDGIVLE